MIDGLTISVADVATPLIAGLILWGIKNLRDSRVKLETTLETNRESSEKAMSQMNTNVGMIGVTLSSLKTWSEFHQKQDDERHEESMRERQQLRDTIERRKA